MVLVGFCGGCFVVVDFVVGYFDYVVECGV